MPTEHQGISPTLVSMLSGKDEASLPPRLTVSMLPGQYPSVIFRNKALVACDFPVNEHMLTCRHCGRKGKYDLGMVLVDAAFETRSKVLADQTTEDRMQCTGYFRCKRCNAAGEWDVPPSIHLLVMVAMIEQLAPVRTSPERVTLGHTTLFDGYRPKWATDGEEHFLAMLREQRQDAFVWNRLGNMYLKGRRPELAMAAFEESIRLDPTQVESHISIGGMLFQIGVHEDASQHLRLALVHARRYTKLNKAHLRDMLTAALQHLVEMHAEAGDAVPVFPTLQEYGDTVDFRETDTLITMSHRLDLDVPESFHPLAEMFMGILPPTTRKADALGHARRDAASAIPTRAKVGRNDPCPCGSSKKYKKCCGR